MVTFFASIALLIIGYLVYGKVVENVFGIEDSKPTPAIEMEDGVDYIPMSWPRIFLIQFLNIAGLGPIFGAIAGALWGPVAFLWIVFGCIFAGAVHDYFSGMLSIRHGGSSIPEIVGFYLGDNVKQIMRVFTVVLLLLVGVVFVMGPAGLLSNITGMKSTIWVGIIIVYYLLATVLPVDKLIGKIYPLFGASLLIMAFGIGGGIVLKGYSIPELTLANLHPKSVSIFPFLFITIACGAISGFHATQSPLMARCTQRESEARRIFYGSMIAEGIIALIWAAAAMSFFGGTEGLAGALANGGPAVVVNQISSTILGKVGGVLALLGVVACPITSGDTAFRSARLAISDSIGLKQDKPKNRYMVAVPLFAVGIALTMMDFSIIWRYFSWANQTLAMIVLWASAAYLAQKGAFHWMCSIPAVFMSAVTTAYILQAPEGFSLPAQMSNVTGIAVSVVFLGLFMRNIGKQKKEVKESTVA
ncbi:Carbon starvation protein CstA [Peptoclostridium litorale DSM 5388]|uniref:Putative membrane protein n=1 Tax=Peptoclostridium litorale DSM 5388 TaxID=1121324 RepID=A0A069R9U0_PEPLI|nr:carbon starvation protein A [Peptoclostridium litorale]KDR93806.1 putative membrane protein [Peptoclostridium litorale DSM 5388]SIN86208.1 Carbon starvation protein CstA [Peptoclostridium litorale DSM 5388]